MSRLKFSVLGCLVVVLVGCSAAGGSTNAAGVTVHRGVPEVCELIDVSRARTFTGVDLADGRSVGTGHGCTYLRPGGGGAAPVLSISVDTQDSSSSFDDDIELARRQVGGVVEIGLGEQSAAWRVGATQSAEARKGSMRLRVLVEDSPVEDAAIQVLRYVAPRAWG